MILGIVLCALIMGFLIAPIAVMILLAIAAPLYLGYMAIVSAKDKETFE